MIWTDKNFTPDPAKTVKLFDTERGPYLISLKQLEIMQACREPTGRRKIVFVTGPKWTSKTVGTCDAVCDHLWNVEHASVCVIASSIGAGSDSGVWTKLIDETIPEWVEGDFGFEWWKGRVGERQKGASKRLYVEVLNKFGKKSYAQLSSLKDERQVEKDFFNTYYSMILWGELQNYSQEKTYETLLNSLRKPNVPEGDHVLLCDGNPSDKGKRSWQYKKWFQFRIDPNIPEERKPEQQNLRLIQINLDDNPFLTDSRKAEIRSSYGDDPSCYARYVKGEWVEASMDAVFGDVYKKSIHIVGDEKDDDPEVLCPTEGAIELMTGWDFGPVNPAVVFCEQAFPEEWKAHTNGNGSVKHELSQFRFFDELCFLDVQPQELSLADYTEMVMKKMDFWEKFLGHPVLWTHFSDRSVVDVSEPDSNRLQHTEVKAVSGDKIQLIAVDRRPGSVSAGIRLWRRLLFQRRILISADRCPALMAAMTGLTHARGPSGVIPYSIAKGNSHKHPFDAARYLVVYKCWDEMMEMLNRVRTQKKSEMRVLTAKL